jgi:hypothetical protein
MMSNKKGHRSVEVADPDLGGAGVKIESAFLVDLGGRIERGKDQLVSKPVRLEQWLWDLVQRRSTKTDRFTSDVSQSAGRQQKFCSNRFIKR